MKKILLSFLLVFTLLITVACDDLPGNGINNKTAKIEVLSEVSYVIGTEKPIYRKYFNAKSSDGLDIKSQVTVDDSEVIYTSEGSYDVNLELIFNKLYYSEIIKVNVVLEEVYLDKNNKLNIYYLNDLHGAVLENEDSIGLAKISNLILDEKNKHQEQTLFIAGGDMLQGQIFSNYYDGASVIDLLNDMKLDAFILGNHEFDWGIDVVTDFFDGTAPIQANYPLLAANAFDKENDELLSGAQPYTIINKGGLKVAIIGTIGYGLESSISFARVEKFYFSRPEDLVKKYAKEARDLGADIVIAVNHQSDNNFNKTVSSFKGDESVDAIFNGHTHATYVKNSEDNRLHIVQSGSSGSNVGLISLTYHEESQTVVSTAKNLNRSNEDRLNEANETILEKINMYNDEILPLYQPIMHSAAKYSKDQLANYIAKLMQSYTNADVAIHNFGGTRDTINQNEGLSYSKLFQISPFDNSVVTVEISGKDLSNLMSGNASYVKPGVTISNSKRYVVATNDYIYGGSNVLKAGTNPQISILVLDLMVQALEAQVEKGYTKWTTELPISFKEKTGSLVILPRKEMYLYI